MSAHGILINRRVAVPLQTQLENALRDAITSGRLPAGERILSTRDLQTHLGLSRNTVINAFEQLHSEGYLITERGVGTFVAPHMHALPKTSGRQLHEPVVPSPLAQRYLDFAPLAHPLDSAVISFRPGTPALDKFPLRIFARLLGSTQLNAAGLDYGDPLGHAGLRSAIARRLQQTRGVTCSAEQIIITTGAQSAFMLILRLLLHANDRVVIEDPGYPNFRAALLAARANIFAAPVDEQGIDVRTFASMRAKLAYVTPSHQYPTGTVLSLERRVQLLDWAVRNSAWIIEDDYDSEFNYTGRPIPSLQGLGGSARVIYTGTFSKVLAPSLRIGYVVVPGNLLDVFRAARVMSGGSPDFFVQAALARFLEEGHLGRHISRMRRLYDQRRTYISERLSELRGFRVRDSRAGLHFIVELPPKLRDVAFAQRARERGVLVPALSAYYLERPRLNGIVIGYAATPVEDAAGAIKALAASI